MTNPLFTKNYPIKKEKVFSIPIKTDILRIACFDMGKVNFAFYVEDFSFSQLESLREEYTALPVKLQRKTKGPMNKTIKNILQKICLGGKRVYQEVIDIREDITAKKLDMATRRNLLHLLSSKRMLWVSCDIIVIEKQYTTRQVTNIDALRLEEICIVWFLEHFSNKIIENFGAAYKTYVLGAPKMTKLKRKKWTTAKAIQIYKDRKDKEGLADMCGRKTAKGKKQKPEDIADCITMCQAYKYLSFIVCFSKRKF